MSGSGRGWIRLCCVWCKQDANCAIALCISPIPTAQCTFPLSSPAQNTDLQQQQDEAHDEIESLRSYQSKAKRYAEKYKATKAKLAELQGAELERGKGSQTHAEQIKDLEAQVLWAKVCRGWAEYGWWLGMGNSSGGGNGNVLPKQAWLAGAMEQQLCSSKYAWGEAWVFIGDWFCCSVWFCFVRSGGVRGYAVEFGGGNQHGQ